jgi:hypothetical protein
VTCEYEVKVLRADGRLVDNGTAQKNNLGGFAMVLPVKVIGTGDGQWDASAWKTDAFYGNPLSGFAAPWRPRGRRRGCSPVQN